MSRDAIAEVLGRLDYGDHKDEVTEPMAPRVFALIRARTEPLPYAGMRLTVTELTWAFERLLRRTDDTGCWLWRGYIKNGYPVISVRDRHAYGHRLALALKIGSDPGDLYACHSCDVRICWNPAHLFAGTQAENMRDAKAKGRTVDPPRFVGMDSPKATLTDDQAREIFAAKGLVEQRTLAAAFGVSQATIWRIQHGRTRQEAVGVARVTT